MIYADLALILEELEKEGRIAPLPSPTGEEMITPKADKRIKPRRGQD